MLVVDEDRERARGVGIEGEHPLGLRVAVAQARSAWLDPAAGAVAAAETIARAAERGAAVVAFPEAYLGGYPLWMGRTGGADFDDDGQKDAYAAYLAAAVLPDGPELAHVAEACAQHGTWAFMGVVERAGPGTAYCSIAVLSPSGGLVGMHRKLMPTYDERLVWAPGDGAGLRTYEIGGLRVGALLCWENWMPQARYALYADGADVHLGLWPGAVSLTGDITRFIAQEGRVWSIAVGGVIRLEDIPDAFPLAARLRGGEELPFDGGSAVADPQGEWVCAPCAGEERLLLADCDLRSVRRARLTFDPAGHYSRPDVFGCSVDRSRRAPVQWAGATS